MTATAPILDDPPPEDRLAPPLWLYFGVAEQELPPLSYRHPRHGIIAGWDLKAAPHGLVAGGTGAGKSTFVDAIIRSALNVGMQVIALDGKESGAYAKWKYTRGVLAVEDHPLTMAAVAEWVWHEMRERYATCRRIRNDAARNRAPIAAAPDWQDLLVIIDEYQSWMSMLTREDLRRQVESNLVDEGRRTRECRIHLLFVMQDPRAKTLDGGLNAELKGCLRFRVGLGEIASNLAQMLFDDYALAGVLSGTDEQGNPQRVPPGRGLVKLDAQSVRFQGAYVADPLTFGISEAECARRWALIPERDPDWQMWSVARGLAHETPEGELVPLIDAAGGSLLNVPSARVTAPPPTGPVAASPVTIVRPPAPAAGGLLTIDPAGGAASDGATVEVARPARTVPRHERAAARRAARRRTTPAPTQHAAEP